MHKEVSPIYVYVVFACSCVNFFKATSKSAFWCLKLHLRKQRLHSDLTKLPEVEDR